MATKKTTNANAATEPNKPSAVVHSVKGFDRDLKCRGFQFEPGKTYTVTGKIEACKNGFHACENPLDILQYYPAGSSRFFTVEQSGDIARHSEDSKIASAKIIIGIELSISDMVKRAVEWVFSRSKPEGETATGDSGAASATGYSGAASATGDSGAASATGYSGAASATGKHSVAVASGKDGRAMAAEGCAICLVNRDPNTGEIRHIRASKVGENGILPDVWYSLSDAGEFVKVEG